MTGTAIIITLEALALVIWVVLAMGYDERIRCWEDRMIRRVKRRLCERWLNQGFEARKEAGDVRF